MLVDTPYVRRPTSTFRKKLVNIVKQVKPTLHLQPIPRPFPKVQTWFARKDPVPRKLLSHVVYNVNCRDCTASYVGKMCRQVTRRFEQHGKQKSSFPYLPQQFNLNKPFSAIFTRATETKMALMRKVHIWYFIVWNKHIVI